MTETLSHPAESAEFLSRLHDGELSPDEAAAFEAHRRECPECRASVAEFERALAAYRSAPVSPHASDLSARILRRIRAASPSRRPFGVMFGIDVRWAGALAAALLVVIIGAPVFSRRGPAFKQRTAPESPAAAAIPAYVLDAEEERPAEKRAEAAPPARMRAAPESEAKDAAAAPGPPVSRENLYAAAPSNAGGDSAGTRRDELAATNADKRDRVAALEGSVAQESAAAPLLQAAAPPAEKKELSKSTTARRQSAAAPVGGEAGAGPSADDSPVVVHLTIQSFDGAGEPPEVVQTPSDERLAALRGRKYLLVVEAGGRIVAVEDRPAGRKPAKEKAREADEQREQRLKSLADSILRELVFQPGDRSRRLVVAVQ